MNKRANKRKSYKMHLNNFDSMRFIHLEFIQNSFFFSHWDEHSQAWIGHKAVHRSCMFFYLSFAPYILAPITICACTLYTAYTNKAHEYEYEYDVKSERKNWRTRKILIHPMQSDWREKTNGRHENPTQQSPVHIIVKMAAKGIRRIYSAGIGLW